MSENYAEDDPRRSLLGDTDKLNAATEILKKARQTAAETEDLGNQTLSDLEANREIIERAHARLPGVNENVNRGERVMKSIKRRIITNRILCALTTIICLGLIGLIIYLSYFDNHTKPSPPHPSPSGMKN